MGTRRRGGAAAHAGAEEAHGAAALAAPANETQAQALTPYIVCTPADLVALSKASTQQFSEAAAGVNHSVRTQAETIGHQARTMGEQANLVHALGQRNLDLAGQLEAERRKNEAYEARKGEFELKKAEFEKTALMQQQLFGVVMLVAPDALSTVFALMRGEKIDGGELRARMASRVMAAGQPAAPEGAPAPGPARAPAAAAPSGPKTFRQMLGPVLDHLSDETITRVRIEAGPAFFQALAPDTIERIKREAGPLLADLFRAP